MKLSIIAAVARNRVIGLENRLPWDLPEDLMHFMRTTWGKPCVMGSRTYESIGRALPGRDCIVLSRSLKRLPDATVLRDWDEVRELLAAIQCPEAFVIGGAKVYREALPWATDLHLTHVQRNYVGDSFFPEYDPNDWHLESSTVKTCSLKPSGQLHYSINHYTRKP